VNFVKIPAGKFLMGSPESEVGRDNDEIQHEVEIPKSFEIMDAPVTQSEWVLIYGENNPSYFKGHFFDHHNHPVESVSWDDVQIFISKMNAKNDGYIYRLPTEAEWEYACGPTPVNIEDHAWFSENSERRTHPVRQKFPNQFGLYDMLGNVWEWCQDFYGFYSEGWQIDPQRWTGGSCRVVRGGSWYRSAQFLRSAYRWSEMPGNRLIGVGFRLVRTLISSPLPLVSLQDEITQEKRREEATQLLKSGYESIGKAMKILGGLK
jgi:formylglycine-generating enzyme required for sulfatase activity